MSWASSLLNTGTALDLCMVPIPRTLVPVYTLCTGAVDPPAVTRLGIPFDVARPGGADKLYVSGSASSARRRRFSSCSMP